MKFRLNQDFSSFYEVIAVYKMSHKSSFFLQKESEITFMGISLLDLCCFKMSEKHHSRGVTMVF